MLHNNETLRPKLIKDFNGQNELVNDISIMLKSAKIRMENPDHILFSGPPGLGKTTLAEIIANEIGVNFIPTTAPLIERPSDLVQLLINLKSGSLLFIDEIHALDKKCEEILYTAMEDSHIDMIVGEGPKTKSIRIKIENFTLVGATTLPGKISGPLRDRFGYSGRFRYYSTNELTKIVNRSAMILGIKLDNNASGILASRSQGTPRIVNNLLRRVRDYQVAHNLDSNLNSNDVEMILDHYGVDSYGLDNTSREILSVLISKFKGGPVGIQTLAVAIGEDIKTLETMYEPYLMRTGMINRTPQGRVATSLAYSHISNSPSRINNSQNNVVDYIKKTDYNDFESETLF